MLTALWIEGFHRLYPEIPLYGCPNHVVEFPELVWAGDLDKPEVREIFAPDLILKVTPGVQFAHLLPKNVNHFGSLFVFHPQSKTLHVDDTFCYFTSPSSSSQTMGYLHRHLAFHNCRKWVLEDPAAFTAWLENLCSTWDFENICIAHNANLIGNAKHEVLMLLARSHFEFVKLAERRSHLHLKLGDENPDLTHDIAHALSHLTVYGRCG